MRHATFEVPADVVGDFTERMTELKLENSIVGRSKNDHILIAVAFDKSEADDVDELEDYLDELIEGLEEPEEEEEEEEQDEK